MVKTYELGKLSISDHESQTLTGAFGLEEKQFDDIVNTAREAWNYEDTVSESVEFLVKKLKNSELVLGLLVLGRIWEENSVEEEEEKK
ncbi:MAG: hypothetical protein ACXADB_00390 [Candidatus Hermodarchaeia archaeon]